METKKKIQSTKKIKVFYRIIPHIVIYFKLKTILMNIKISLKKTSEHFNFTCFVLFFSWNLDQEIWRQNLKKNLNKSKFRKRSGSKWQSINQTKQNNSPTMQNISQTIQNINQTKQKNSWTIKISVKLFKISAKLNKIFIKLYKICQTIQNISQTKQISNQTLQNINQIIQNIS